MLSCHSIISESSGLLLSPHLPLPVFSFPRHHPIPFQILPLCHPPPLSAVPPTSLSPVVSCCCSLSSLSVFHLPFPLLNTSLYSSKTKDGQRKMMRVCACACASRPFPCHSSPRKCFQKWDIRLFPSAYVQNKVMSSSTVTRVTGWVTRALELSN